MKRIVIITIAMAFAPIISGQATTTQSELTIQEQFKKIEQTLMRYPSMAFIPSVWYSRPFLHTTIAGLENNNDLQTMSMLYVLNNPVLFATAVEGLSKDKDSLYLLLNKLMELNFDVNQPINNSSLLSLALGKNFDALPKIINHFITYLRNPGEIVLSAQQTEQLKQLIAQTNAVQNDITYSVIVLSPEFPELLAALIEKGLRVNSTQFVFQILILLKYDTYSSELLLRNLKALFEQGAIPFAQIQFTEQDGTLVSTTPREYAQQFIHTKAKKDAVIELIDQATNNLKR